MIAVLNRWAAFLYGPLMDDRPRRLTEGMAEGFGRDMAQNVFGELIDGFDVDALAARQQEALAQAGL